MFRWNIHMYTYTYIHLHTLTYLSWSFICVGVYMRVCVYVSYQHQFTAELLFNILIFVFDNLIFLRRANTIVCDWKFQAARDTMDVVLKKHSCLISGNSEEEIVNKCNASRYEDHGHRHLLALCNVLKNQNACLLQTFILEWLNPR